MKKFWRSKTIWFNALYLLVALAACFGFKEFEPSPIVIEIGIIVSLIVNLFLRFKTKLGINK